MKRTTDSKLRRRAFLTGTGAVAIGLPFLEGMPERSAWAQGNTPSFGLFIMTANGVVQAERSEPERFWPSQTGALTTASMEAFKADRVTGELSAYADRLLIVRGVNYPGGASGCGHSLGLVQSLTGRGPNPGATNNTATASAKSIDTLIAEHFGEEPLTLYAGAKGGFINEKLSFTGPGQVRAAEGNPFNVYLRLTQFFGTGGDGGGGNAAAEMLVARRKSLNDLVREELNDLRARPQLSRADQDRLDQHFQGLRDLENTMVEMGVSCSEESVDVSALEAISSGDAFRRNGTIEQVVKLQLELAALAFSCNAYRVATLQAGDGTDGTRYEVGGRTVESFHHISHRIASDGSSGAAIAGAFDTHVAIDRIRMQTLAHGIQRWSEHSTGGGSLLDSGFIMWSSHNATGPLHSWSNLPYIIAGSGGGVLRQGQYVDAGGVLNERLLNTLARAAGVPEANASMIGSGFIDSMLV